MTKPEIPSLTKLSNHKPQTETVKLKKPRSMKTWRVLGLHAVFVEVVPKPRSQHGTTHRTASPGFRV